jgi:alpha-tubulin suppressor-like RCC1 family protein
MTHHTMHVTRAAILRFMAILGMVFGMFAPLAQAAPAYALPAAQYAVWGWGYNGNGQLGDGTTTNRSTPVQASGLTDVTTIAAGWNQTLALKSDGTVWAWGINTYGQVGDGTLVERHTPVQVSGLGSVTAIAAGGYHSLALKSDGSVWAWGWNVGGAIGDGTTINRSTPVQVSALSGVTAIAAGAYHSLARKSDGTVWIWGMNQYGQLGDGTTTGRALPVQVSGLTGVSAIAASVYQNLALKSDGTVRAWGYNGNGQLGDGTIINRATPVQVSGLTDATALSAGFYHSLALKNNGTVWAWGSNELGQLGDGTGISHLTPVQVSGISGVSAIAGGNYHSMALKGDGTVWSWGYSPYVSSSRSVPGQVIGLSDVTAISANLQQSFALAPKMADTSAVFSGGTGTYQASPTAPLFAKGGAALTLSVSTHTDVQCVKLTGDLAGLQTVNPQTSSTGKGTWIFTFVASGASVSDGIKHVTATAGTTTSCTADRGSAEASYTLDNTAPALLPSDGNKNLNVLPAGIVPAPNAAGWNNSDVTINWSAADAGSGIASGPTPATGSVTANTTADGTIKTASAADRVGNSGSGAVTVKLDKDKPTLTPARTPANANGWNNGNVTIAWHCADALSGLKSCTDGGTTIVGAEGANQSRAATAVDVADNSASVTVGGINIDTTATVLSGAPTTQPNPAGWYNRAVSIHWMCTDPTGANGTDGSGFAPDACPADSQLASEGRGQTANAMVSDQAGNTTSATSSPAVDIDLTAPNTAIAALPVWNNDSVTVNFDANDALSGVAATYFMIDGGAAQSGISVTIADEGEHTLAFWSVDTAGNQEAHTTISVKIDKTSPTIRVGQSPAANADGWNNGDVTVTFTCADALSGITICIADGTSSDSTTLTAQGQHQHVTGTATDAAGNSAHAEIFVSIDTTKPTLNPVRTPANQYGWNNGDVIVDWNCADALSGLKSCTDSGSTIMSLEGAGQSATGTATDAAGNSASITVGAINIDTTAPTLSGAATTEPNANGWYNGDVTVQWTCDDVRSGIVGACPANSIVTGEGDNLSASEAVKDRAGNPTNATVDQIKIYRIAPNTFASVPAPLASGWYAGAVLVTLHSSDNLSGVAATYYAIDGDIANAQTYSAPFSHNLKGVHTITFWSVDKAGNSEDANTHSMTLIIDNAPPTISGSRTPAANGFGWNNSPVVAHFECADAESGIAVCEPDYTFVNEGAGQSYSGMATNNAGNTATATVGDVNIDMTAPTITLNGIANGGSYILGAIPSATCGAVDALSGLVGACSVSVKGGNTNGVGTFHFSATALDKAGNTAMIAGSYRVIYRFDGFLQPINDTGHAQVCGAGCVTSIFKGGSTIPVKFQLKQADGTIVQAGSLPQWSTPQKGSPTIAAIDESSYSDPATSGDSYLWDSTAQQYSYKWSTKSLAIGYYYRIYVTLDDDQTYTVDVGLR